MRWHKKTLSQVVFFNLLNGAKIWDIIKRKSLKYQKGKLAHS